MKRGVASHSALGAKQIEMSSNKGLFMTRVDHGWLEDALVWNRASNTRVLPHTAGGLQGRKKGLKLTQERILPQDVGVVT